MILTVTHRTLYRYDTPVRGVVQSHRLTPAAFEGQRPLRWNVSVTDGVMGGGFRDGGGDWVQSFSVVGPLSEIEVLVTGEVETGDTAGVLRGHREVLTPLAYLRKTAPTRPDAALRALAQDAVAGASDMLDRAHRLMAAVADAIAYVPGRTDSATTAAEALAQGEGVCQDHTHAMIAAARSLGQPARYVSGYLMSDVEGVPNEAAHAWAEIWVEGLSAWVGFDAANRCCPNELYIRLGSGLDALDAAPIRGTARGTGGEHLDVTVAIEAVQQ